MHLSVHTEHTELVECHSEGRIAERVLNELEPRHEMFLCAHSVVPYSKKCHRISCNEALHLEEIHEKTLCALLTRSGIGSQNHRCYSDS